MSKTTLPAQTPPRISCHLIDLGLIDYAKAYAIQLEKIKEVFVTQTPQLLICEHFPILTLGRVSKEDNFVLPRSHIEQSGVPVVSIDRGGEITFHGPGQIVIYPIFELSAWGRDLKRFMYKLEETAIDLLRVFGIVANRMEGQRGIFVQQDKIGSIGIGVKKWVSFHGMSLNVNTDLRYYQMIRPCGMDVAMTSMRQMAGKPFDMAEVKAVMARCFEKEFNLILHNA